jgi:hypothetical protein
MEQWSIEGEASALLRAAGLDGEDLPSMVALAERHLGRGAVVMGHCVGLRQDAQLYPGRILVRARLAVERARFAVAHELAEWHLGRQGYREDDLERVANGIAAALVAPRDISTRLARRWPLPSPGEAAATLRTTQTLVALRYGEVTDEPIAVVGPRIHEVRGAEWGWPAKSTLRGWAMRKCPADVNRAELEPGRVILHAVGDDRARER